MLIIKRLLVFLPPLALLLALNLIFGRSWRLYWLVPVLILLLVLVVWELTGRQTKKNFWYFLFSPAFFVFVVCLFLLFIEQPFVRWLTAVLAAGLLAVVLEQLFVYFYQHHRYQPCALENIYNYFNLLALFLFFSTIYSFIVFLDLPLTLSAVLVFTTVCLFGWQICWLYQLPSASRWFYVLVLALAVTEFFVAVSFLPTGFYVNGAILTIVYYFMAGLICSHLLNRLEKAIIRRYGLIALAGLIIILGTARWL